MATIDSAAPLVGQADDLSPLAWVHGELRRSLETANRALRRYLKEAEVASGSEVDAVDPSVLRTARAQEAATILAEGQKQAQIVRADAQAEAAQIYADSFGKDPEFYAFWRAMQSYRVTFQSEGAGQSTFVLRPGEGYLSEFGNRSAR